MMEDQRHKFAIDNEEDAVGGVDAPKAGSERFVKGPIPLSWITKAGDLGGSCLFVGMLLWHVYGMSRNKPFQISHNKLSELGAGSVSTAKRALDSLAVSGLIGVRLKQGQRKEITINI
jgi:hypothetical protein